jgi:hypothetical protein
MADLRFPSTNRNALLLYCAHRYSGPADHAGVLTVEAFLIFEDQLRGNTVRFVVSLSERPWVQHDCPWLLLTWVYPRGYAYFVH